MMSAFRMKMTFGLLAGFLCRGVLAQGVEVRPLRRAGRLVVFDAALHGTAPIKHYCMKWHKDSDRVPAARPSETAAGKSIHFSATGARGAGASQITFSRLPPPAAGMEYAGFEVVVSHGGAEYARLPVDANFWDGTSLSRHLTLRPGTHAYEVTTGFRRAKTPVLWNDLQNVVLQIRSSDFEYDLHTITMLEREKRVRSRILDIGRVRKVHEVLPAAGPIDVDGAVSEAAWSAARPLDNFHEWRGEALGAGTSPIDVRFAYDATTLYLATRSRFATAPVAKVKEHDMYVYNDEAQEIFFDAPGRGFIQFVINAAGTVFDCVNGSHMKNVPHRKAMRYANESWDTELAFPFDALGADPASVRRMGFQIVQTYYGSLRRAEGRRTTVWEQTTRFPAPSTFGVLVFNRHAFGPGAIEITGIERLDNRDRSSDFRFECTLDGFAAGTYRARLSLSGHEAAIPEETLELASGRPARRVFTVPRAANTGGRKTFTLELVNARGDSRLAVADFRNIVSEPDLFGQRVLNPRPKKIAWQDGAFAARRHTDLFVPADATARTRRTAEVFADRYYKHTGVRLRIGSLGAKQPARGIVLRLAESATFDGKQEQGRPQGYRLAVMPERVEITGFDEPGLHYGGITFFQLMKNDWRIRDEMPVPCVEILDWPDILRRIAMTGHGVLFKHMRIKENRGIEYLIDWADRFVARNKSNFFVMELSRAIVYEREQGMGGPENFYPLADLEKLGAFCRDNFIEPCPAWQVGGHADWWLLIYHPELREQGYRYQSDVTHPDHNRIVFNCMLDVIEALDAKWATSKSDEWWGYGQSGEEKLELLRGKTRPEVFLEFHLALHAFLKSNGVRMFMFNDMLTPYSGGKKWDIYKVADRLPKDIVIGHWTNPEDIPYFAEKGFEIWRLINRYGDLGRAYRKHITGSGSVIYGLGNDKTGGLLATRNTANTTYALMRAADYGWNMDRYPGDPPGRNITLRNLFALTPNPYAAEKVTPLDLSAHLTHTFSVYLKEHAAEQYAGTDQPLVLKRGEQTIAHIPMRIGADGAPTARDCVIVGTPSESATLPVKGRYSSLIFLHTAFINNPNDTKAGPQCCREWNYGFPCGEYAVRYADGTELTIPVRLTTSIRRYNSQSKNRATNENRYVRVLHDANYDPVHLYQYEWVNPHPEKTIESVTARHPHGFEVSLVLFAVSGRDVWMPRGRASEVVSGVDGATPSKTP